MFRLLVGIVAMSATPWKLEENFRILESYVREAATRRAQLVIAPESIIDDYMCAADPDTTRERMLAAAQTVPDDPYLMRARALSRELGIYQVISFPERAGEELFNTCVLIDPAGEIIARYSKAHPANESHITPGCELRPFDAPFGQAGFLICSDRHYPDNFGVLGAQGVQVIYLPMDGWGGPENTRMRSIGSDDFSRRHGESD